jgi:hypothetical protein
LKVGDEFLSEDKVLTTPGKQGSEGLGLPGGRQGFEFSRGHKRKENGIRRLGIQFPAF